MPLPGILARHLGPGNKPNDSATLLMSNYPDALGPVGQLPLGVNGRSLYLPVVRPSFPLWSGDRNNIHTFGGKDLLLVDGTAQFAEVAILRAFQAAGWQGRWLETYGNGKLTPGLWNAWHPDGPRAQVNVPIEEAWVNERMKAIAVANGNSFSGCWDVVAWKGERLVFAESKKQKKDKMRGTQGRLLEAALRCGIDVKDFLVVEWSAHPLVAGK